MSSLPFDPFTYPPATVCKEYPARLNRVRIARFRQEIKKVCPSPLQRAGIDRTSAEDRKTWHSEAVASREKYREATKKREDEMRENNVWRFNGLLRRMHVIADMRE